MKVPPFLVVLIAVAVGFGVWAFSDKNPHPSPPVVNGEVASAMAESERTELLARADNYAKAAKMSGDDDEVHQFLLKKNAEVRSTGRDRYKALMEWENSEQRRKVLESIANGLRTAAGRK